MDAALTITPTITPSTIAERFLAAVASGAGIPADLFADDAVVDCTVPNWRYVVRGAAAAARNYGGWFADPGVLEEVEVLAVDGGAVVTYLLAWEERGVPHAAHHCHRMTFNDDGRITTDRVFCGGRWDAGLLAQIAAACDAH